MLVALAAAATAYHIAAKPAARTGRMSMSSEWAGDLSAEVETAVAAVQRAMQLWCVVHAAPCQTHPVVHQNALRLGLELTAACRCLPSAATH